MKTYVITTGLLFAALAALHVAEVVHHWRAIPGNPWPAIGLALSVVFAAWAGRLVVRSRRS
jgi:hypothetical protein